MVNGQFKMYELKKVKFKIEKEKLKKVNAQYYITPKIFTMISTTNTIHIEKKKRLCSVCKSQYHNSRTCSYHDVFGWGSDFITETEKKLNDEQHNKLIEGCDIARKKFEIHSARNLQMIERRINRYIIPYSSQNGNPPLLNYLEVYGRPYNATFDKHFWTNEAWVEHIHSVNKKSERQLSNRYVKYYSFVKKCNSFVDKLNFTIEKSKKCEKDIIHTLAAVTKKHHLPLEICEYIFEYVYTCPYDQNHDILHYVN